MDKSVGEKNGGPQPLHVSLLALPEAAVSTLSGIFDVNATLARIDLKLQRLVIWFDIGGDVKKKTTTARWRRTPEDEERHRQTQELLARRIAYHRAKTEEERAQREREAS